MTKQHTKKIVVQREALLVYILFFAIGILGALYMYFLSASIIHVVMRTETEANIGTIYSELSNYETELMLVQYKISEEVATLEGYTEATNRIFVDRKGQSLVLRDSQ